MGENCTSLRIKFVQPNQRGLIPIGKIHCSKSLRKILRKDDFSVSFNQCFTDVVMNCANRKDTWINQTILDQYVILHYKGLAHSVEIWQKERLVGGLYGLALGSAFFAESMFSLISNASKLALIAIMAKVNYGGFTIFDTQFPSKHLESLGGITVTKREFEEMLFLALSNKAEFNRSPVLLNWDQFMQYACDIPKNVLRSSKRKQPQPPDNF